MNSMSWVDQLDNLIQKKHMLLNCFYQAWTRGELTRDQLQEYGKEYYHHVKAFPTYISALHSRCEDMEIRKGLLDNLIDEEAGTPNHPDLWRSFVYSLGVSEEELNAHHPKKETQDLIDTFRQHCNASSLASGVAALYTYESQIPPICKTKIEGLKQWYGINKPEDYRYFSVHETADVEHSLAEKRMLATLMKPGEENTVLDAADSTLNALNSFLTSFL